MARRRSGQPFVMWDMRGVRRRKAVDIPGSRVSPRQAPGLAIQINIHKIKDVFTDEVLMDMKPITDLARALGTLIRNRVRYRGVSATGGQFSRYSGRSSRSDVKKYKSGSVRPHLYEQLNPFWAPGHYPQGPDGTMLSHPTRGGGSTPLKSKKHKGARAYPSRKEYQMAIASDPRKKFTIMGQFWTGLAVRPVRAGYVKLAFFKSSFTDALKKKKLANRTKAAQMNKHESVSILRPNRKEMEWANRYCRLYITSMFLNSQGAQELRIKTFRAAARLERRIKSWAKQLGGS